MPDNCAFDNQGRMWIATDGSTRKRTGRTFFGYLWFVLPYVIPLFLGTLVFGGILGVGVPGVPYFLYFAVTPIRTAFGPTNDPPRPLARSPSIKTARPAPINSWRTRVFRVSTSPSSIIWSD